MHQDLHFFSRQTIIFCFCGCCGILLVTRFTNSVVSYTSDMKNISALHAAGTETLNLAIQRNKRRKRRLSADDYSPMILFDQPPHPQMLASVIIPAKNEAANITKTLDALRLQTDENGKQLPFEMYEILLLANNCTDETYAVAKAYQQQHPQLSLHIAQIQLDKQRAHIGTVRRLLMDEAFRRHNINGRDGIILSTDGDTEVDAAWIVNTLNEMSGGCDAVGGRILTRDIAPDCKLYYLQDTTYRYLSARLEALTDPTDAVKSPHFQCFGASLAVRCSAYHKAGRLPVIPFLEDEAFSRALYRVDAKVRKSPLVKVYTSARIKGRVKAGLSVHLKELSNLKKHNVSVLVESAKTLEEKWRARRELRACWHLRKEKKNFHLCITSVAATIGISPKWLLSEMDISMYFGEFWEKTEFKMYTGKWRKKQTWIPIQKAIAELRIRLKT